jgi:hypothetical protein
MADQSQMVHGLPLATWEAMFRPGMPEFAATQFSFTLESAEQVRIAFGNHGPCTDLEGTRVPVFTHAVTLPPHVAVELARLLLKFYAEPVDARSKSSGQL